MLRSVKSMPGGVEKMVPSETRESLCGWSGVGIGCVLAASENTLPASDEKILGVLAIDGLVPEKVRLVRFCDVIAELGVSLLEEVQLRVLTNGVGQATSTAGALIIPARKRRESRDCRVECCENRVKQKRLAEHVEGRHLVDWKIRGKRLGVDKGGGGKLKKTQKAERRVRMSGMTFIIGGTAVLKELPSDSVSFTVPPAFGCAKRSNVAGQRVQTLG